MKVISIIVISYYWAPWNNAGTFRWWNFGKFINFDVLTSRRPVNSFHDETINDNHKVKRFGKVKAVVWGFLAIFKAGKYDLYIVTSPPESLLFCAWILQLMGKKVLVDMRDPIYRIRQPLKFMVPVYRFFYNRINNVIVSWKIIDKSKPCIYHGYEDIPKTDFKGFYDYRVNYGNWIKLLRLGYCPDQSHKPKGYVCSSFHTFKHLNYPVNFEYHVELDMITPESIETQVNKIKKIIHEITTKKMVY